MGNDLRSACDGILQKVVTGKDRVPGVVAMITDRSANIYEGAAGERILGASQAMTTDTVFAIFSTTKAITGTAILQCVEEGKLDLDAPAKTYVPDIGKLEVLDGFDAAGKPKLRAPKRDITTRMLMLHTAGLGYDFFNANYLRLAQEHGQPSVITCSKASLTTPLLFDPGDKWEYGSNIDWCGQVVESIRGKRLGEVMTERIFTPLGMEDIAFSLTPSMRARLAAIHQREPDGSLTPLPDLQLPPDPEVHMGGHGLYASIGEYMKFIRMWLNDGAGPQRPCAQERDGRGRCPQRPASAPGSHDAARRHSDAVERCRVLPRPEEILVLHLHGERRGRADRPAGRGARLGRARQHVLLDRSKERVRRILGDADPAIRRPDFFRRLPGFRDGRLCDGRGARGGVMLPSVGPFARRRLPLSKRSGSSGAVSACFAMLPADIGLSAIRAD